MPNTPKGLPYPVATDPVSEGAAAIEALARAVDAISVVTYRKTTPKSVLNTNAETDLLNGELQLAAGVMGTNRLLRLTAWGDYIQNYTSVATLRFKLKLGAAATIVMDTSTLDLSSNISPLRYGWRIMAEVLNLGAANTQLVHYVHIMGMSNPVAMTSFSFRFATGEGIYQGRDGISHAEGFNVAAIDTAAAMNVALTVTQGYAQPTLETKLYGAVAEIIS